jgi:hypothetical protein
MADLPIETPFEDGVGVHVYHQYTLLSDRRDEILEALQAKQIACSIFYPVPIASKPVSSCGRNSRNFSICFSSGTVFAISGQTKVAAFQPVMAVSTALSQITPSKSAKCL